MKYTIDALNAMSDDKLRDIASQMGIKASAKDTNQDLVYKIIDQDAIDAAANATAAAKPRRGRKPKLETAAAAPAEAAEKPRRGRKPKAEAEAATAEAAPAETAAAAPEAEAPAEKKRRGRKPKAAAVASATPDADAPAAVAELPAPAEAKPAPAAEAMPAEQAPAPQTEVAHIAAPAPQPAAPGQPRVFTPRNQPASREQSAQFESFFQQGRNKQFAHRPDQGMRQQQKQHGPGADTPIVINEPGAPQQQQQQGKQGKKNKNKGQQQLVPSQAQYNFDNLLRGSGVLEVVNEGHGFLRSGDFNYMPSPDDILVSKQQIKQWALKTGDVMEVHMRPPRVNEKYFTMTQVDEVNGRSPEFIRDRQAFEHLTPLFPEEKFNLTGGLTTNNVSTRVVDMFAPIGKGQRALIVAPPKTGKTILLKNIANAIAENHPETYIMILLIDERPEEVTDMSRSVNAEVIASTFDEPADRHVKIAGIVLEKAKRMVECGHDVVILLDSITRLARAYNTAQPASGKILSGGVDANALQKPKRFFGAARNIENGGSLTIIATALTETSSKMDEVIFEEFKGTGNMELQLDRKMANKRIFPAVDIMASSTRRDDLLLRPETLNRMWIMRRFLSERNPIEALEFVKDRIERTVDNDELLRTMGD